MSEKIIEELEKVLNEISQTGISNQHLNNAIDMLFALKFKLEMESNKND